MPDPICTIIWQQFGAAIDMLEHTLRACPADLWRERLYNDPSIEPEFTEFWYISFHVLFWLDFYLSDTAEGFAPPAPFTRSEMVGGQLPDRVYTPADLLAYLEYGRRKCRARLETLADAQLTTLTRIRADWSDVSEGDLLLDNMRHVQEHAAELSLFLGQKTGYAQRWITRKRGAG